MAKSFWSRRKDTMSTAGGYIKATEAVSRPTAFIMATLGIIVVGGLLFGVFWGARWSFDKLSNTGSKPTTVSTSDSSSSDSSSESSSSSTVSTPPVTVTSSTATTTPSQATAPEKVVTIPATTENLPYTGPASNTAVFFAVLIISYLAYRKKQLRD